MLSMCQKSWIFEIVGGDAHIAPQKKSENYSSFLANS